MRFVQYYFGLPLAMIVICIFFVPVFSRLKVFTAYEFLEERFDVKTRTLTSFLFPAVAGLSTGISIFALFVYRTQFPDGAGISIIPTW